MDLLVYLNHLNFGYNRRKHLRDFCILVREASAIFFFFLPLWQEIESYRGFEGGG